MQPWHPKRNLYWLFFLTAVSHAQSSPAALDLKSALSLAESSNLELRAARQQRAVALSGIRIAGQIPNPIITFAAARDLPHESLLLDQSIELGGKRGKRMDVAREEQKATDLDINILARQVRHQTRDAFYRALLSRAQAAQSKAALDLATRIRDAVKDRYEAGDVAQLEVIQTEVEVARATADYEVTVQGQKSADAQLAALLNRPLDRAPDLLGRVEDLPHVDALPAVTEMAFRSNGDLQRTAQQLAIEEQRLRLAKSARIPNVDLQAGVDLNSPPDFNVGPRGQVAVALPLFNHGQADVAQSNARLELLRLSLMAQRTNTEVQVLAAYFDYDAKSRQAAQYSGTIVPQTVKLEEMAEDSYRSGKSNLLILIDAQRRLNDTRKAYLDSIFSVQSAFSALEEVVGAPLD